MDRSAALDRMVQLYHAGMLAPFLGAGMSRPACPDWKGFIEALAADSPTALPWLAPGASSPPTRQLIEAADRVVRQLKFGGAVPFEESVRAALGQSTVVPPQTAALARIWWPLVLTTNYDDWYVHEVPRNADYPGGVSLVGRGSADCEQVLRSLRSPAPPLVWALQGFLGGQHPRRPKRARANPLAEELVIGHEEYRRVSFTAPHFRQAFGEVFRSRSLLFLGSGLADQYLLDLFGQVLELAGPNPVPHFAMVKDGEVDDDFLERRLNIFTVRYSDHGDLPRLLDELRERIDGRRPREASWAWSLGATHRIGDRADTQLEVVRSRLPEPGRGACLAVSAGLGARAGLWVSGPIDTLLRKVAGSAWKGGAAALAPGLESGVTRLPDHPVFLCAARKGGRDRRHLRAIGETTRQLLDAVTAAPDGFGLVHLQLLAVGRNRAFPAHLAFIEMVRSIAWWFSQHPSSPLRVQLHVIAPDVLHALSSGKIDLAELLTCRDLRLWVETEPRFGGRGRQLVFLPPDLPASELVARFIDAADGWSIDVAPAPTRTWRRIPVAELTADDTLASFGVAPGMTVRLVQGG